MVRLKTGGSAADGFSYSIEASKDGKEWFRIVDKTWPGFGGWIEDEFAPVEAQYLRLTGHYDSGYGRSLTVYEVEAYSPSVILRPQAEGSGSFASLRMTTAFSVVKRKKKKEKKGDRHRVGDR